MSTVAARNRILPPALAAFLAFACGDDGGGPIQPMPDTIPPLVSVVFPAEAAVYDETSNGLLDVRVIWSDESGVAPATAEVRVDGVDVTSPWGVHAADDSSGRFEETLDGLLGPGARELVIAVEDSAGNVGADTIALELAFGEHHATLPLGGAAGDPAVDVEYCADDGRIYVAHGPAIEVFEAWPPAMVGRFEAVLPEFPSRLLCIEGDPLVYAMVAVERFDRTTLQWTNRISGTFSSDGVVQSRADPAIIWVGEDGPGVPVRVDVVAEERLADPAFPVSSQPGEGTTGIAVLEEDAKIYYTRFFEGGVVVGDPATGEQLTHIDLHPTGAGMGAAPNIVLHPDDTFLYVATRVTNPGLVEVSTETDTFTRMISVAPNAAADAAINGDGTRIWVTVQDADEANPASSLLVDPETMTVLQEFPRPVPPGTATTWVLAAEFAADGRLLFQARDDWLDVYLIR